MPLLFEVLLPVEVPAPEVLPPLLPIEPDCVSLDVLLELGALLEPEAPERWPAFHSSRLIWPSWFLSSCSKDCWPFALDEEPDDDGELEAALPPEAAEEPDEDGVLLCDIDDCDFWLPLCCFAESAAYADTNANSEKAIATGLTNCMSYLLVVENLPHATRARRREAGSVP